MAYAMHRTASRDDAADVVAETFDEDLLGVARDLETVLGWDGRAPTF
jgi:hypothetical protein